MWILNKRLKGYTFFIFAPLFEDKIFFDSRGIIPRGVSFFTLKYDYLGENETKNKNILTRWSVTQAGSNYEKMGVQNLVGLSL